ncbi:EF-hand domain-containing protein [Sphingomonas sp. PB2P19]|uniref:EF-hand domain-containing protein n=1 Tax=Sphingomonas rhamnosi TaxID=3096156 RepID=UPI002FCB6EE6
MLNPILLAGTMIIAAPAIAQTAPQTGANPAPATATAPVAQTAPATTANPVPTGPQAAAPAPAAPAQAAPAEQPATGSQVAQIVDAEFPTYDKDTNGTLSSAEFGDWMTALKVKSDPSTKADSPAVKKFNTAAFVQADTDKSKSVSKDELTGFLSKG